MYANATAFKAATEIPFRDDESRSMRTLVPVASAALRDDPLDLRLRAQRLAQSVDVIEQLDHAHQRIPPVPRLQLMRRGAGEGVVHDVNVHAAAAEAGARCLSRGG